jgi:hypothetical protein
MGSTVTAGLIESIDEGLATLDQALIIHQLDIPEDWDTLAEGEKTRRLNAVIGELSK